MISFEQIVRVAGRLNNLAESKAVRLMRQMQREQPALCYYLLNRQGGHLQGMEQFRILIIALLLWQIVKRCPPGLRQVTIEEMAQVDHYTTMPLIGSLYGWHRGLHEHIAQLMVRYPEKALLQCLAENLDGDPEMAFSPDNMGYAYIHLQAFLEALLAGQKEPRPTRKSRPGNNPSAPPGRRRFSKPGPSRRIHERWQRACRKLPDWAKWKYA